MTINQRKRQRQLAKKHAKASAKAKVMRSSGEGRTPAPPRFPLSARNWPVHEALISEAVQNIRQGTVILSRKSGGSIAVAIFLVDTGCMGIKSAFGRLMGAESYGDLLERFRMSENFVQARPECLRKLVEGALAYAADLGFPPDPDYHWVKAMFGDIDSSLCTQEFIFGEDYQNLQVLRIDMIADSLGAWMKTGATVVLTCVLFAGVWSAPGAAQEEPLPEHIRLLRPPGEAPSPLVVWASGCSGFFHPRAPWHFVERAQHPLSAGYAIAYVDYIAAAGHETACSGELTLPEIGKALLEAVRVLGRRHGIDADRVVLLGGSLGGGGVLAALSLLDAGSPRIAAALALYPVCEGVRTWNGNVPVWIWFAGADRITPPTGCRDTLDRVKGPVTKHTYAGVQHAFDMRGLPTDLEPGQAAIALDPVAAEDVWKRIERVLSDIKRAQ